MLTQVTNDLWLADLQGISEHDTTFADRIVSVCQDKAEANVSTAYSHVPLADNVQSGREHGGDASYGTFRLAADLVRTGLAVGETVVVHCHMGRNRSAAVSAAALATSCGIEYDEAFSLVKDARPEADPCTTMKYHAKHYIDENQ